MKNLISTLPVPRVQFRKQFLLGGLEVNLTEGGFTISGEDSDFAYTYPEGSEFIKLVGRLARQRREEPSPKKEPYEIGLIRKYLIEKTLVKKEIYDIIERPEVPVQGQDISFWDLFSNSMLTINGKPGVIISTNYEPKGRLVAVGATLKGASFVNDEWLMKKIKDKDIYLPFHNPFESKGPRRFSGVLPETAQRAAEVALEALRIDAVYDRFMSAKREALERAMPKNPGDKTLLGYIAKHA